MSPSSESIAVLAIAVVGILAWALFLIELPKQFRSVFRFKLWAIRDKIVDDVMAKRLPNCRAVQRELAIVRLLLINPEWFGLLRLPLFLLFKPDPRLLDAAKRIEDAEIQELTQEQRELFAERHKEIVSVLGWRATVGTLSGVVVLLVPLCVLFLCSVVAAVLTAIAGRTNPEIEPPQAVIRERAIRSRMFALEQRTQCLRTTVDVRRIPTADLVACG